MNSTTTTETCSSRPESELLARLGQVPTPNIGDAMGRLGILDGAIQAVWPGARLIGRALTVWTRAGDNLAIHQALEHVRPGDVIVVNGEADRSRALIGELIAGRARNRGAVGFVIDGVVRDPDGLRDMGMPVFARGCSPAGPFKNGPGVINEPVAVGRVVVSPGDVIVADQDGVVCVSSRDLDDVVAKAEAVQRDEAERWASIQAAQPNRADGA